MVPQAESIAQETPRIREDSVMEHLNWGYLQLGLVALAFGGLQAWWIGSTLRKRDLARPISEQEFRKTLERMWARSPGKQSQIAP